MNFVFRFVLFVLGLVFAISLAVAALLLAIAWGLRSGWARLTGKPVTPWVMRFNPGAGFNRFQAAARKAPTATDTANARARGESVEQPTRIRGSASDVTDVSPKSVSRH